MNRLTLNVSMLERYNKDWTGIMKDLKGEAKATDEKEYARAAEGDEGFIEAIIAGNEVVARLKARITFISRKRDKVNLEASHVSTLTSSQAGMIEHAAVQASHAAVQESLSLTQLTPRTLDTSLSADTAMHLPVLVSASTSCSTGCGGCHLGQESRATLDHSTKVSTVQSQVLLIPELEDQLDFHLMVHNKMPLNFLHTVISMNNDSDLSVRSQYKTQVESVQIVCFKEGIFSSLVTKLAAQTPIVTTNNSKCGRVVSFLGLLLFSVSIDTNLSYENTKLTLTLS